LSFGALSSDERICLASGFKEHVTVELFYGARLQDVQGRIVGVGKNTRHLKLKSVKEIDTHYFVDLLQQVSSYHKQGRQLSIHAALALPQFRFHVILGGLHLRISDALKCQKALRLMTNVVPEKAMNLS
jgi:hypothetical protein